MRLTRGDHVIFRSLLLQHQVHGADVIRRVPPVAFGVEISEPQLGLKAELYTSDRAGDFPCHKLKTPARAFMIE